jgi:undecaprenyl-diphosphatase
MQRREQDDLVHAFSMRDGRALRRGLLLAAIAGASIFVAVAVTMMVGAADGPDRALLQMLRSPSGDPVGGLAGLSAGVAVTTLGSTLCLTLASLAAGAWLLYRRRIALAVYLGLTMIVGTALRYELKVGFARARPDSALHRVAVDTFSFPSSHAMMSTIACLTLGGLALRFAPSRFRAPILTVALGLPLLIGFTRVYLGVHWPSDVVAGWSAGVAWAAGCALGFEVWRARRPARS